MRTLTECAITSAARVAPTIARSCFDQFWLTEKMADSCFQHLLRSRGIETLQRFWYNLVHKLTCSTRNNYTVTNFRRDSSRVWLRRVTLVARLGVIGTICRTKRGAYTRFWIQCCMCNSKRSFVSLLKDRSENTIESIKWSRDTAGLSNPNCVYCSDL